MEQIKTYALYALGSFLGLAIIVNAIEQVSGASKGLIAFFGSAIWVISIIGLSLIGLWIAVSLLRAVLA